MDPYLSDLRLSVLHVLWRRGEARVTDVHEALRKKRKIAPTTVATVLTRLEKRGLVSHRTEGRQFVFRATVSEDGVRGSLLRAVVSRFFRGDVPAVVSHLLGAREVRPGDLERVKALIAEREREREKAREKGGRP